MKIRHHDIIPDPQNPFAECKLNRKQLATVLTDIVKTYADGFVMAVNNEWGTGKTTFIKMWEAHLHNEGLQTIYFNAWENDFHHDPLVALTSELQKLKSVNNSKVYKTILEKGAVIIKNVAPALVEAAAKKYIDLEVISEAIKNTTKAASEILEDEIKEYNQKKEKREDFKKALEQFIKKSDKPSPVVFFVDELDRCRPNYAVEILEKIKHYFSVPGIVFVLSIDKTHLASSIKGFYGSENIDSDSYLKRFIDLEYSLPDPITKDFVEYLFQYYGFKEFFSGEKRLRHNEFRDDGALFKMMAIVLFSKNNSSLRFQERIFALSRLVLRTFISNAYVFPHLLFWLTYIKSQEIELFRNIERKTLTVQELSDAFCKLISPHKPDGGQINIVYVQACLLWFYNNSQDHQSRINLLERKEDGTVSINIKTTLDIDNKWMSLSAGFESIYRSQYDSFSLSTLIGKINLTESIIFDE